MKRQIIITRLFEFGGSNSHLKLLFKYFGAENILLVIDNEEQLAYLNNLGVGEIETLVKPGLLKYARLNYPSVLSNIKEFFLVVRSILSVLFFSLKHSGVGITINSTEPEKLIYLFWLPFIKVNYILHTSVLETMYPFTSISCNIKLGRKKKIITVSQASKQLICKNWNIRENKRSNIKVIYNCLPADNLDDHHANSTPDEKVVITLGYLIGYKNPSIWLEVAKAVTAKYKHVRFMWLGNGPLYDHFKNETLAYDRISFAGLITEPDSWLKRANIYYQPSLYETHGIAVVEAMSNSLPCVVSDTGGLPESVQHNYNGLLVDPLNVDEQVNAICNLLDDDNLAQLYGQNSYKKYMQSFTYAQFKHDMDEVYGNDRSK